MSDATGRTLILAFHGRVLDHLGIQMYQSPTAAIAELISNAWDADAETVEITLPDTITAAAEITVRDSGNGMTFEQCQNRFLKVGYDCRTGAPIAKSQAKGRPLLGRKGIGKFAGFGISQKIEVDTVSAETGEHTVFELDLGELRGTEYIQQQGKIAVKSYDGPDSARKLKHGTTLTLRSLSMSRAPNLTQFVKSMSRRFTLAQRSSDFLVTVNGVTLPADSDLDKAEFVFPRDYDVEQVPEKVTVDAEGWASEELEAGKRVKWRFVFYEEPIKEDELRGISIFANGKLAQRPFLFNLVGGISAQQGLEYLSGKVEADYIDELSRDIIATERQRINWEDEAAQSLLEWGRKRVVELCRIWKARRADDKLKRMEEKLAPFADRLANLQKSEQKTLRGALSKLAQISAISAAQFEALGEAILTSWEAGRLKELVHEVAHASEMSSDKLVELLVEANVLTALNTYEAIKTKLTILESLRTLIEKNEVENKVRDYIAENPWLISARWETFKKEISLKKAVDQFAAGKGIKPQEEWSRRIDLLLASGENVLLLEFMQPGKRIDRDHISRFEYYVNSVRNYLKANTGGTYNQCTGYLVASRISEDPAVLESIEEHKRNGRYFMDWNTLLAQSESQYEEFIEILKERSPQDDRLSKVN